MADFPDKVVNPSFSAKYGLPPGTELIGPPMQGTLITKLPGGQGGPMLAYDGPWPPPEDGKAAPAPAGTSTPPPEGAHKTDDYRVTSLAPSMELTNSEPVPYNITATAQNDTLYSPNVNYRGTAAMRLSSRITVNTGDEPANGKKGVVSGAQGGMAAPITASKVVRVNGSPAIRHGDLFEMDKPSPQGPGNTVGEGRLVRDAAPRPAPPDHRSWWQRAKDGVASAAKDVGDFDAAHGHVLTRGLGAIQAVGGGVEAVGGVVGGVLTAETGVGALAGGAVAFNGADNFQAGLRTLWTGQSTATATQTAVGAGIKAAGGSPTTAAVGEAIAGLGPGGIASAASLPGRIARLGKVAEDLPSIATAAEGAPAVSNAAGKIVAATEQASVTGAEGVRVTKMGTYKDLKKALKGTDEQANHLNQDAAFRDAIPTDEGAANAMRGNAFRDIGTPHYDFHNKLEEFWNQYRRGGDLFGTSPTIGEYDDALRNALSNSGYSPSEVNSLADYAAQNREAAGLTNSSPVPRIPGRINQSQ